MRARKAAIIRFVYLHASGYLIRSDLLPQRLECCEGVERVESFISPLHAVPSVAFQEVSPSQLPVVLSSAIGGLLVQGLEAGKFEDELLRLDNEFSNRFAFSWVQVNPVPPRRIAWVQGRENIGVSRRAYEAAQAMGVSIVMIDNPGHWLQDDNGPYAHLREAFIPVSIELDEGFTERIVKAIQGYKYPVDGLMTISDVGLSRAYFSFLLGFFSNHETYRDSGLLKITCLVVRRLPGHGNADFYIPPTGSLTRDCESVRDSRTTHISIHSVPECW